MSLSMSSRLARRTGPSTPAHALYTSSHGATECTPAHVREEAWQIPVVESPKRTPDVVATDGIRPRPRLRTAPRWRALTPVRTSAGAPRSHQPLGPIRTVAPEGTLALVAPQPQRTSICFTQPKYRGRRGRRSSRCRSGAFPLSPSAGPASVHRRRTPDLGP